MARTRIKSIDVRGFRAFGRTPQPLKLSSDVAVVWGPNSQGKTSLAEALEFLFTGSIVRRELLASAKDEFAGTLRNVHLAESDDVSVEVEIEHQGNIHTVRRTLASDYGKKGDCASKLEVDGRTTDERAFVGIGVRLSQPPLAAPVLMQHTLPYVFSAGPKERTAYFKALLDVEDLDRLLEQVESHGVDLAEPTDQVLAVLRRCAQHTAMGSALSPLAQEKARSLDVESALSEAAAGLLREAGADVPGESAARFEAVGKALRARQAETFPLGELGAGSPVSWELESAGLDQSVRTLDEQRKKVEREVERLIPLFEAALKVPLVAEVKEPIECPLCEDGRLSPERVAAIREKLQDTKGFRNAEVGARAALTSLTNTLREARDGVERVLPGFVKRKSKERKNLGFDVTRARRLAGADGAETVSQWVATTRTLLRARRVLGKQVMSVAKALATFSTNLGTLDVEECEKLRAPVKRVAELRRDIDAALTAYKTREDALLKVLPSAVAKESKTEGWQELLNLRRSSASLRSALVECEARARVQRELEGAVKAIKNAMGEVLDEKIASISGEVERWWNLLRPGEPTFFSAVKRRTKASRTIDFKAALSQHADRSNPETRDAVAVLSYSQLQCLGLSLFLARAIREGVGFVLMDDPVLAGDEDHRPTFVHKVIPELVSKGIQVIVMTQDQLMRSNLLDVHAHLNVDCFHVTLDPATGTAVDKTSDDLEAMLARARPYVGNVNLDMRKRAATLLRDGVERFCKELLVRDRRAKGDTNAAITDYVDSKGTLGHLVPLARALLTKPDEPGKLEYIRKTLNPGGHDAVVPSGQDTKQVFDHLNTLKRAYI